MPGSPGKSEASGATIILYPPGALGTADQLNWGASAIPVALEAGNVSEGAGRSFVLLQGMTGPSTASPSTPIVMAHMRTR